jgi:hypothetical protein
MDEYGVHRRVMMTRGVAWRGVARRMDGWMDGWMD